MVTSNKGGTMAQHSKVANPPPTADHRRRLRHQEALVRRELRRRFAGRTTPGRLATDTPTPSARRAANASSRPLALRARSGEPELGRRTRRMRVRNLVAVEIAATLGFSLGLLEALERLPYGPTLGIAEIGVTIAVVVGLAATFRSRERIRERVVVSLLRAGLSGGLFVFVFEGMRLLLKIGDVGLALASWVWAGVLAVLLLWLTPAGQAGRRAPTNTIATGDVGPRSTHAVRPGSVEHSRATRLLITRQPAARSQNPSEASYLERASKKGAYGRA
jgi:hypothetical protein